MITSTPFHLAWKTLMLAATAFVSIEVPYLLAVNYTHGEAAPEMAWGALAQHLITLVFIADIAISFRTPVLDHGRLIVDPKEVRRRYLAGPIVPDVIAAFPYQLLFAAVGSADSGLASAVMLARLAKLPGLWRWFIYNVHVSYSVLRLSLFVFIVAVTAHWIACGWYVLTVDAAATEFIRQFVVCLYWSVTTLTTVGYGDISPDQASVAQMGFGMVVMVMGVAIYAYVIGNIASLFANIDMAKTLHEERSAAVKEFMLAHDVPRDLQTRVKSYLAYLWGANRGHQTNDIMGDLPPNLQIDLALFLNRDILRKVPLFEATDEGMLRELAQSLSPCIYLPGDHVVREGEIGTQMFFVSKGSLEVRDADGKRLTTLEEGSFFGEVALLTDQPRTADIVASDFCELYSLDQTAFRRFLDHNAEFARGIQERVSAITSTGPSPAT